MFIRGRLKINAKEEIVFENPLVLLLKLLDGI
jgi:hypothetical protein